MSLAIIANNGAIGFTDALRHPITTRRAVKVAIIVGSILIAINQGDLLLQGILPSIWKLILTYMVPYCVSSYSSAMFIVELSKGLSTERIAR